MLNKIRLTTFAVALVAFSTPVFATFGNDNGGEQPGPDPAPEAPAAEAPDPGVSGGDVGGEGYRAYDHDVPESQMFNDKVEQIIDFLRDEVATPVLTLEWVGHREVE